MLKVTFAVAVNNRDILEQNLLASDSLRQGHPHELLLQENFTSAALAYNDAMERANNDLVIFVHQDVFLPRPWFEQLNAALQALGKTDANWGVLGCWGATVDGKYCGHIYSSGLGVLGKGFGRPVPVQTLDEIVLIVRKGSALRFDTALPHFHLYGTDLCMRAARQGLVSYAISAFCVHNTSQILDLPADFYQCYRHVKSRWKEYLPIQTSCIRISRFDTEVHRRRLQRFFHSRFGDNRSPATRVPDPTKLLSTLQLESKSEMCTV